LLVSVNRNVSESHKMLRNHNQNSGARPGSIKLVLGKDRMQAVVKETLEEWGLKESSCGQLSEIIVNNIEAEIEDLDFVEEEVFEDDDFDDDMALSRDASYDPDDEDNYDLDEDY
jgi:hypothetical protein